MFHKTQKLVDPVKVVLSKEKEKPYDDVKDYPVDLTEKYKIDEKHKESLEVTTKRIVRRVRGKFERELAKKQRNTIPIKLLQQNQKQQEAQDPVQVKRERWAKALKQTI